MNIGPIQKLQRCDGIPNYWLGELFIANTPFHVECVEVFTDTDGRQRAKNPDLDKYFDGMACFDDAGEYQTILIKKRPHVVVIFPFGQ